MIGTSKQGKSHYLGTFWVNSTTLLIKICTPSKSHNLGPFWVNFSTLLRNALDFKWYPL